MNLFILIYFKFYLFFSFLPKKNCSFEYKYSHFKYFPPEKISKNNNNFINLPISINYDKILICGSNHKVIFDRENIANISNEENKLKFKYSSDFKYYNSSNKIVVACDENNLLIEFNDENLNVSNKKIQYNQNDNEISNENLAKCELSKDSNRFRKNQIGLHIFPEYIISAANVDDNGKNKKYFIAVVSINDIYSIHFESRKVDDDEDEDTKIYSDSSSNSESSRSNSESSSSNSESSNSDSSNSSSESSIESSSENILMFKQHLKIENNKKEKIITTQFIDDKRFYILNCHVEGTGHYKYLNFSIYFFNTVSQHELKWKFSHLVKNTELPEYCYEFRNIELFKIENNHFSLMYECYHQNKLNFINIYFPSYTEIQIINVSSFKLPFIKPNTYRHCIDYFTFPIFCAFYDFDNDKNILHLYGFKPSEIDSENKFHIEGYFHREIYDFNSTIIKANDGDIDKKKINLFIEANYSDLIIGVEDENKIYNARIKYPVCNNFENFFKSNVDRHFYQYEIAENGEIFNDEKEMQIYINEIDTNNENACKYRLSKTKDEITIFGKNHQKCKFKYSLIPKISAEHGFLTDQCEIKFQNCLENCYYCSTKEKCDQCKPNLAFDENGECLCDKSLNIWIKKDGKEICLMPNININDQICDIDDYSILNNYTNECVKNCDGNGYSMIENSKKCKCLDGGLYFENKCYSIITEINNYKYLFEKNSKIINCSKFDQLYYHLNTPNTNECVASCEDKDPEYHPINGLCVNCTGNYISPDGDCIEHCNSLLEYKEDDSIANLNSNENEDYENESNRIKYPKRYCFKDNCPPTHPIKTDNKCQDYCNDSQVEYKNSCLEDCPKGTYKYKQRCICDTNISLWYYENEEGFIYTVCDESLSICPPEKPYKIKVTNECVKECPEKYPLMYNNTCIDRCEPPYEYFIKENNTCAEDCDDLYLENSTNTCYSECPEEFPFIYEGKDDDNIIYCIKECNETYGFFVKNDKMCYPDCPDFRLKLENTNECIGVSCPDDHKYKVDLSDLEEIDKKKYENRCYSSCPDDHNLTVEGENNCYTKCPVGHPYKVNETRSCHTKCPEIYDILLVGDDECLNFCPPGRFSSTDEETNKKYCFVDCPSEESKYNFYYKNTHYNTCVSNCKNDDVFSYLIFNKKQCENSCSKESPYEIYQQKICYENCSLTSDHKYLYDKSCVQRCNISDYYSYHLVDPKLCAHSCTQEYPLIEPIHKECYKEKCPENYSYLFPKNSTCTDKCPEHYFPNDFTCIIVTDYVQDDTITNEDKLSAIANNLDYLNQEMPVITLENGKTVEIVNTANKKEYDNLSSIDLSECETKLKQHYNIPEFEHLLILKIDTVTSTSVKNEVNYEVYAKNGTKLDLSPCSDVKVLISSPITNPEALKLDLAKDLEKQGVDIYNTEGEFYNNFCFSYSSGGNDMTLSDRYNDVYPDVDVCDSGCVYSGINTTNNKISCDCNPINTTENNVENEETEKINGKNFFINLKNYFNYKLFSCSDYIFHFKKKYIQKNFGFWFSIIIMSVEFVCFGLCVLFLTKFVRKKVYDNFDESLKTRLKSLKIRKANKIIVKKKRNKIAPIHVNRFDFSSSRNKIQNEKKEINIKKTPTSNFIEEEEEEYSNEELSEMPFETAIKKDTRNIMKVIVTLIFAKLEFLKIIFFKEEYEFYPLLISVYLMSLHLDFSINALLYNDSVVSQKYNNGGSLNFVTILGLGFFSNLIGNIICKSLEKLTLYNYPLEGLVKEVKDKKKYKLLDTMLSIIKKRLAVFFGLQFLISMMCTYYLYVFCNVYGASQVSLFVNYLTGIAQSLFISVGIAFCIALSRYFGLKLKIKYLYYFSRLVDQESE